MNTHGFPTNIPKGEDCVLTVISERPPKIHTLMKTMLSEATVTADTRWMKYVLIALHTAVRMKNLQFLKVDSIKKFSLDQDIEIGTNLYLSKTRFHRAVGRYTALGDPPTIDKVRNYLSLFLNLLKQDVGQDNWMKDEDVNEFFKQHSIGPIHGKHLQ